MIVLIVVTGKSQVGKSTLAKHMCGVFDRTYKTVFTTDQLLDYIEEIRDYYYNDYEKWLRYRYKWIFWDEPQLETDKTEFWSQRNIVLGMLTSSFGFLKQNMICALPNIRRLSDNLLTNLTFRVDVKAVLDRDKKIKRIAYIKKPLFIERKNKFGWVTCQIYTIPEIEEDKGYNKDKADNFFKTQLPAWRERIRNEGLYRNPIKPLTTAQILKMFKTGVINQDLARRELEKKGMDFVRADLLLDGVISGGVESAE
jgi:energy-coupling factor transporter ATP-binding protein EcfA2